jgi:hypothetical protein
MDERVRKAREKKGHEESACSLSGAAHDVFGRTHILCLFATDPRWSSGYDSALSQPRAGFDSPSGKASFSWKLALSSAVSLSFTVFLFTFVDLFSVWQHCSLLALAVLASIYTLCNSRLQCTPCVELTLHASYVSRVFCRTGRCARHVREIHVLIGS